MNQAVLPNHGGEAQPTAKIERDGVHYTLLGTAHVSRASVEAVRELIGSGHFDAVAVELCPSRYKAMTEATAWREMNLFRVIRDGRAGLLISNLILAGYQQRLAAQLGIEPGAEMKAAIEAAAAGGLPVQTIDRDIGTTLKRIWRSTGIGRRFMLFSALLAGFFNRENISAEQIEELKQGDLLESAFTEFAARSPHLYDKLITERDRYMAACLRRENAGHPGRRVLAVVGAGHLAGTARALGEEKTPPEALIAKLDTVPPAARWVRFLPWLLLAVVLGLFVKGFSESPELGWKLMFFWVAINGGLAMLGALAARAHPLSALSALFAAPLTSLNPAVAAGMVSGAVEVWRRPPKVEDFERLRDDATSLAGWYHNRVGRALLVFLLTNLGSSAGTWIAGWSMIQALI